MRKHSVKCMCAYIREARPRFPRIAHTENGLSRTTRRYIRAIAVVRPRLFPAKRTFSLGRKFTNPCYKYIYI